MSNSSSAAGPDSVYEGCYAYTPEYETIYGYVPSLSAGIAFDVLFGVSLLAHLVQMVAIKVPGHGKGAGRQWWMLVFAVGALTELIGWAARTWSAVCPYTETPFLMQISTLIIAPAFFTAGIYIILGRLIQRLGRHTSILSARAYLWIFCTCDVISLLLQAVGGGLASAAFNATPPQNPKLGTNIMVGGIVFQMASIAVFTALYVEFLRRCRKLKFPRGMRILVAASAFSVALIFARSVYRTIELLQGWSGFLISHERYFIGLDGCLMIGAVGIFNFAHPAWLLRGQAEDKDTGEMVVMDDRDRSGSDLEDDAVKLPSGEQTPNPTSREDRAIYDL